MRRLGAHAAIRFAAVGTWVLAAALAVSGCASGSSALGDTVQALWRGNTPVPQFDPRFEYLRTTLDGRTLWLVLGYREANPAGDVEVWYSAAGEAIQLQHGRIVATSGLPLDWRAVRTTGLPAWPDALAATNRGAAGPWQFERERDEMPGYRFHVRERVSLHPVAAPTPSPLAGNHGSLRWFEQRSGSSAGGAVLPPALFAVDASTARAVYSRQCMSASQCLTFETWSPATRPAP